MRLVPLGSTVVHSVPFPIPISQLGPELLFQLSLIVDASLSLRFFFSLSLSSPFSYSDDKVAVEIRFSTMFCVLLFFFVFVLTYAPTFSSSSSSLLPPSYIFSSSPPPPYILMSLPSSLFFFREFNQVSLHESIDREVTVNIYEFLCSWRLHCWIVPVKNVMKCHAL